jgi:hypothetical protein
MGAGAGIAAASVAAAGIGAIASSSAAGQASGAAKEAAAQNLQMQQFNIAQQEPFRRIGVDAINQLGDLNRRGFTEGQPNYLTLAQGAMPGQMSQAELEATPGYRWNLAQGLQATQNNAAARGLGVSGAALKGAATYATGLADSTYQNQFNNAQNRAKTYLDLNTAQQGNAQNLYSRLQGTASVGQNAASQTGSQITQGAATSANLLTQAGQNAAAGTVGMGNAATNAINSGLGNYLTYKGLQAGSGAGGGGGSLGGYTSSTGTAAQDALFSGSFGAGGVSPS